MNDNQMGGLIAALLRLRDAAAKAGHQPPTRDQLLLCVEEGRAQARRQHQRYRDQKGRP